MYRALYRKWRPNKFCDVVGQDFVTTILENEVKSNKIGHAYLFIGTRGTGKTTCARIFAKAINCLSKNNAEKPCGECSVCKASETQSLQDIIELDAASNNGVNDIREICESTKFTPSICKYKVYIIDEVHMLSTGAFNALLKTLEEPPSHVVFLLATTEVNKIPATILSRCQKFEFKKISSENIAKRLKFVAKEENIFLEEVATDVIANCAEGAMRDALSILDKCASLNNNVTADLVCSTLFVADEKTIVDICESIINKDLNRAIYLLKELSQKSTSVQNIFSMMIKYFSDLMLVKSNSYDEEMLNINNKFLQKFKKITDKIDLNSILKILDILENFSESLPKAINTNLQLKSFVIKVCSEKNIEEKNTLKTTNNSNNTLNDLKVQRLLERVDNIEKEIYLLKQQKTRESTILNCSNIEKSKNLFKETNENSLPVGIPKDSSEILKNAKEMENWEEVLNTLKSVSPSVYTAFKGSKAYLSDPYVLIDSSKQLAFDLLKKSVQREKIRDIIKKVTGKLYRLGPYKKLSLEKFSVSENGNSKDDGSVCNPLRKFTKKARNLGINVIIEDE